MPLTDEQKAYLIFKEFVGLSDDVLLGEDGDLLGKSNGVAKERFDNSPAEEETHTCSQISSSRDELRNIDPRDVDKKAVIVAGQTLLKIGDQQEVENLVSHYSLDVDDLFQNNTDLSYKDFEKFILRIMQKHYDSNSKLCYVIVAKIAKGQLRAKYGQRFCWYFRKLMTQKFKAIGASLYDEHTGTET